MGIMGDGNPTAVISGASRLRARRDFGNGDKVSVSFFLAYKVLSSNFSRS
jgi:hypothetical protein